MAKLHEYIGGLFSSITNARVMSDLQTIKVAEEYAKHNLLSTFSVPRMRIDEIEMTIPVAISDVEEKVVKSKIQPIDGTKLGAIVQKEISANINPSAISPQILTQIQTDITKRSQLLEQSLKESRGKEALNDYVKDVTESWVKTLKSNRIDATNVMSQDKLEKLLDAVLQREVKVTEERQLGDLNVIVEGHKLKEQKPESIMYIKVKISEEGMEWNRTENNDGNVDSKLIPE